MQQADLFCVPLLDETVGIGQVIEADSLRGGTAVCALTLLRHPAAGPVPPLSRGDIHAVQLVSADALATGLWPIVGFEQIPWVRDLLQSDVSRWVKIADPPVRAPEVVEAFLNACHGLYPWDGFPQADFFDTLLLPGRPRPPAARTGGRG